MLLDEGFDTNTPLTLEQKRAAEVYHGPTAAGEYREEQTGVEEIPPEKPVDPSELLDNPTARAAVMSLLKGKHGTKEIAAAIKKREPNVSKNLGKLEKAGLVKRSSGKNRKEVIYSATPLLREVVREKRDRKATEALREVEQLNSILDASGYQEKLEP